MRISTKCSISLHVLVVLAAFEDKKLTSEILAKSAGCNPVVIRNLLGGMKKAGIVDVQRGTGGATLKMKPEEITIWSVFQAVDKASLDELIGLHPHPAPQCPVGKNIYRLLEKPYNIVEESVEKAMQSYTLKQIIDEFNLLNP